MTTIEFNEKYKDYLGEKHYGLAIQDDEVIEFLDEIFQDLIMIPNFRYFQIKLKYGMPRFYAEPIGPTLVHSIENTIQEILKTTS